MTAGHRHRVVRLPPDGPLLHLLRTPLARTADPDRAERSRYAWGPGEPERLSGDGPARYAATWVLTPLGILHTLTGLTIDTQEPTP